jgi:hypothetical protein
MNRRHARVAVLGGWLLAGAIGCQTQTGDELPTGPIGLPPWTVGGARLGMTAGEAERMLGTPTRSETKYGRTTTTWKEISATFDQSGRAIEVLGDRLTSPHGATILQRGASEAEVVAQIGPGRLRSAYAPSGSGVISCSHRRTGGERTYDDGTTRYDLSVYEDRLASVRLRPR